MAFVVALLAVLAEATVWASETRPRLVAAVDCALAAEPRSSKGLCLGAMAGRRRRSGVTGPAHSVGARAIEYLGLTPRPARSGGARRCGAAACRRRASVRYAIAAVPAVSDAIKRLVPTACAAGRVGSRGRRAPASRRCDGASRPTAAFSANAGRILEVDDSSAHAAGRSGGGGCSAAAHRRRASGGGAVAAISASPARGKDVRAAAAAHTARRRGGRSRGAAAHRHGASVGGAIAAIAAVNTRPAAVATGAAAGRARGRQCGARLGGGHS